MHDTGSVAEDSMKVSANQKRVLMEHDAFRCGIGVRVRVHVMGRSPPQR